MTQPPSIPPDSAAAETTLREAVEALHARAGVRLAGIRGAARSWLAAALYRANPSPTVVIVPTQGDIERMRAELAWFLADRSLPYPAVEAVRIRAFPGWQLLPYDDVVPHPELVGERLGALASLREDERPMIVTTWEAMQLRTVAADRLAAATLRLAKGTELAPAALSARLLQAGYTRADQVEDPGEFAVRGGIVDIFPLGAQQPVRLEYWGDVIDELRRFDPVSQVSLRSLNADESVLVLPARESFWVPDEAERVAAGLRDLGAAVELKRTSLDAALQSLRERGSFPLQDYTLPALLPSAWFWEHLPAGTRIWSVEQDEGFRSVDDTLREAAGRYRTLLDEEKLLAPPEAVFADESTLRRGIGQFHTGRLESLAVLGDTLRLESRTHDGLAKELQQAGQLGPLVTRLRHWLDEGHRVRLSARTRGGVDRMRELLAAHNLPLTEGEDRPATLDIGQSPLMRGFRVAAERLTLLTEEDIFGARTVRHAPPTRVKKEKFVAELRELKHGDFIVHVDYGVGRYLGLQTRTVAGETGDFFAVEYSGGDRLFLPVYRLEGVQKYVGSEGSEPRLDKLGTQGWEKTKKRVKEAVLAMAAELLELYAAREVMPGQAFAKPGHLYEEFAASFEYEETPDQAQAIREVIADLQRPRPMDRLVCGDVGYGKTEVAMRAAFKAVEEGKQAAVLVPTTILAFQHLQTFRERFEAFPVKIEMLSRFVSPKEQKDILARLRKGEVDIVIGTHRILQSDLDFKDLGLLVIDEEHRFGVKHKEKIKQLKKTVHVLTLTATPIPRTLHLSILGLRDLSIIATPPRDRLAIRTYVTPFEEGVLAEAIRRELRRQGQIFFIHNRIDSIHGMADEIRRLVPEVRLAVGHGRMKEDELEKLMLAFVRRDFDLLLCTTIVESGIDVPTANTIVINRADRFGLAELYQLRGRVGRSNQRAYAYLVIDSEKQLSGEARQRLDVIQSFADLGAGFKVAAHDLEIRGAGDILGQNQSGQIAAVGFDLYTSLLEQAVQEIRGEPVVERREPELNVHLPAYIPEKYMPDVGQRLDFYQRLSRLLHEDDTDMLRAEMEDRYGELPVEAEHFLEVSRAKVLLRALRVRALDLTAGRAVLRLDAATPVDPARVLDLVARQNDRVKLAGGDKLVYRLDERTPLDSLKELMIRLRELQGFVKI